MATSSSVNENGPFGGPDALDSTRRVWMSTNRQAPPVARVHPIVRTEHVDDGGACLQKNNISRLKIMCFLPFADLVMGHTFPLLDVA